MSVVIYTFLFKANLKLKHRVTILWKFKDSKNLTTKILSIRKQFGRPSHIILVSLANLILFAFHIWDVRCSVIDLNSVPSTRSTVPRVHVQSTVHSPKFTTETRRWQLTKIINKKHPHLTSDNDSTNVPNRNKYDGLCLSIFILTCAEVDAFAVNHSFKT